MNLELLILLITGFFIAKTYYDTKDIDIFKNNKKYISMGFYGILGISFYMLLKRNPCKGKEMLKQASNLVKYMPVDKSSISMLEPVAEFFGNKNQSFIGGRGGTYEPPQHKRMMNSGSKTTKRSVSETKKKYVASQQSWKCGDCAEPLSAWFEVDHKIRLEHGGSNHIDNLLALCRECHGKKTAMENM
jgi:hypothetical protein